MSNKRIGRIFVSILGIIVGIVLIFTGVGLADEYRTGYVESNVKFGADFYTYQYEVTGRAVNAVISLENQLNDVIGKLIVVIGVVVITAFFALMMFEILREEKKGIVNGVPMVSDKASDRQQLFSLPSMMYADGAPVMITGGTVQKDIQSGSVFATVAVKNLVNTPVKALTVRLRLLDVREQPIGEPLTHQFLDTVISRGETLGENTPILLAEPNARSFTVEVIEVVFRDQTVWQNAGEKWEPFIMPLSPEAFFGVELAKEYRAICGGVVNYVATQKTDMWVCACGELNHENETHCDHCGKSLKRMLDAGKRETLEYAKAERAKAEQTEKAQRAQKNRIGLIVVCAVVGLVALILIINGVNEMNKPKDYNDAVAMMNDGFYDAALEKLENLDYKDSESLVAACRAIDAYFNDDDEQQLVSGCKDGVFTNVSADELRGVINDVTQRRDKDDYTWETVDYTTNGNVTVSYSGTPLISGVWDVRGGRLALAQGTSELDDAELYNVYRLSPDMYAVCKISYFSDVSGGSEVLYLLKK